MDYERILYEKIDGNIVKVTLNRPDKRNALDGLTLEEVQDAFEQADLDEDVRVIIFAGAGKDFSAGHDLSGKGEPPRAGILGKALSSKLTGMEFTLKREDYIYLKQAFAMRDVSKPTIAMVQGNAMAAGWMNASMCDLIVASDDARFSDPVVRMCSGAVEILMHPYDVGFRKAKEMLWTGDAITAQEAKDLGLVCKVVPREKLEEETLALARRIAMNQPISTSLVKRSINHAWDEMGQRNAWQYHMLIHQLAHVSDEMKAWRVQRAEAMQRGGLKEMFRERDGKFQEAPKQ